MKKNIAVIFGGNSTEHDISILTALQLINAINTKKFNVFPVYILHNGKWYFGKKLLNLKTYKNFEKEQKRLREVAILPSSEHLYKKCFGKFKKFVKIDCAVLSLHGKNGEDGTIQGLLELANIPYTSSGVLGCSIGIDKSMMKQVFKQNKIPIISYVTVCKSQFQSNSFNTKQITQKLYFPVIVKPNCLGSSIGISVCKTDDELVDALTLAFLFDEKVVVEKYVENLKEVNISVLGCGDNCVVSTTEEVNNKNGILTFQKKYLSANNKKMPFKMQDNSVMASIDNTGLKGNENTIKKSSDRKYNIIQGESNCGTKNGMQNLNRIVPAIISKKQTKKTEFYAKKIFSILNSKGVVRIDFIIDQDTGKIYANEINTIPGSFAFYLWQKNGIEFDSLVEMLIDIAIEENKNKRKLMTKFSSHVIE